MRYSTQSQQGTILLLSIVFLLLLSVAAVASIRLAAGSLQISNAMLEHNRALQNAERALVLAEEASNDVIDFSIVDWHKVLPVDSNGKVNGCSNGLCFLGEFDNGTTECTASAPLDPKAVFANPENASAAKPSNDSSDIAASYLLVFQCFQPNPRYSLQDRIANPAPSFAWLPQFDVLVRSEGRDSDTELVLMSQIQLPPLNASSDLPGILSVRGEANKKAGSNILVNYCRFCDDAQLEAAKQGGTPDPEVLFNPSQVPAVSLGSLQTEGSGEGISEGKICGKSAINNAQTECFPDDQAAILPNMSKERFFARYFGTPDMESVIAKGSEINRNLFLEHNQPIRIQENLAVVRAGTEPLLLNGSVDLRPNGSEKYIIIIDGDLILDGAASLPKAALIYVTGNLTIRGSLVVTGALAVAGDANLESSFDVQPTINPTALLDGLRPINSHLTSAQRVAWRQGS